MSTQLSAPHSVATSAIIHDLVELMALRLAAARVRKLAETRPKAIHAVLLREGTARSKASFYTKRIYKFLVRFPWQKP
jgi:hypothetical protein